MQDLAERDRRLARLTAWGFALVAAASAALAAFMVGRLIMTAGYKEEKKLPVVVAERDIAASETLTRELLKVAHWPESLIPPGAASEIDGLFKDGKPRTAATGILKGEPIFPTRLASAEQGTAMAALVRPGFRAVPVKVDNAVARAKLLFPGAQVDVVGTVRQPKTFQSITRLVVEDVKVLSVESRTDVETKSEDGAKSGELGGGSRERLDAVVTIEVTPEQAEVVLLGQREGKLDLLLRNGADRQRATTPGVTAQIFAAAPKKPLPGPRRGAIEAPPQVKTPPVGPNVETYVAQ